MYGRPLNMIEFVLIATGQFFWSAGERWQRVEAEGLWNARQVCSQGECWGQFEPGELVTPDYQA